MIVYGSIVTVVAWLAVWCIGESTARLLFGRRARLVTAATRLPLGLSLLLCLLEAAGYFLSIRVAVLLALPLVFHGAVTVVTAARRGSLRADRALALASFAGLSVGLVPVAAAGRFTAAALTNNDGTYYITAADWLGRVPWRAQYSTWEAVPTSLCMLERVLHLWQWRTGTPNLMAAVSALSGLGSTATLAVVTALLFACVPCAAIGVARGLGLSRGGLQELGVGLLTTFSAASAFLGFQHMTGHLGVESLFPASCAAALGCARHGGWRRAFHAAMLSGASVALFADGAAVLVVIGGAALVGGHAHLTRAMKWTLAMALATVAVAPFTVARAAGAAWNTFRYRVPSSRVVFPQRGWLPRGVLDELATLTGVDPWPPWPAATPPGAQTIVEWLGALCGGVLLVLGASRLRRHRGELLAGVFLGAVVLLGAVLAHVHYLQGKVLLTGAAFVMPLCGVGASKLVGKWRFIVVPFVVAELGSVAQLSRPSAFKVVDGPEHDALLRELSRVPPGSLLSLDGLGAPADTVLDEHRAQRAALLDGLLPMQPGLDGGFYVPLCIDLQRPSTLPERAYALQRTTSEVLTRGTTLSAWGTFRLVETDLRPMDGFIAAWAPTHGWIRAEHDPDGRVFRWGEWTSSGTLHAISSSPCARLRGEMRVVRGSGVVEVNIDGAPAYEGTASPEWSSFETAPFSLLDAVRMSFSVARVTVAAPDAAHALAVSQLSLTPLARCGTIRRADDRVGSTELPIPVDGTTEFIVEPPLATRCYQVAVHVEVDAPTSVRLSTDGGAPSWRYVTETESVLELDALAAPGEHRIGIAQGGAAHSVRLTGVDAIPRACAP